MRDRVHQILVNKNNGESFAPIVDIVNELISFTCELQDFELDNDIGSYEYMDNLCRSVEWREHSDILELAARTQEEGRFSESDPVYRVASNRYGEPYLRSTHDGARAYDDHEIRQITANIMFYLESNRDDILDMLRGIPSARDLLLVITQEDVISDVEDVVPPEVLLERIRAIYGRL